MITYAITSLFVLLSTIAILGLYKYVTLRKHYEKIENELTILTECNDEITKMHSESSTVRTQQIDALTGLPDRSVFEDRLKQILQQSGRLQTLFAVMALDIDNFAEVCALSQNIGDKLLKELARRLQMSTRQVDTTTRFAGGYFLFLLPVISRPETAIYVAQRIQDNLLESFIIDGHEFMVTVSIGISVYPVDGTTDHDLIKNADDALRQAKLSGKNKYQFYQPELHDLGKRELSIASLIRSSDLIKELRAQYKPFFNVDTNTPFYIQVTPHLRHTQYGMIPFSTISTISENSGRMLEINEWLLRNAMNKLNSWAQQGFKPSHLAMPVTMRQLENSHFVYRITEIAKELNPLSVELVLEISDNSLPQNPSFLDKLFTLLDEANIKVSIGVVALGHFAMQKINNIPLHYLKIDAKLVQAAANDAAKDIVLSKIIQLAHDESIVVMAEGIEHERQKERLQEIGCHMMEGKLFGYLMPTGSVLQEVE